MKKNMSNTKLSSVVTSKAQKKCLVPTTYPPNIGRVGRDFFPFFIL